MRVGGCGCVGVRVGEVGAEAGDPLKLGVSLELFQCLTRNSCVDEFFHKLSARTQLVSAASRTKACPLVVAVVNLFTN